MTKDRLIQLIAVVVALAALGGSTLLIDPINRQRRDLQLTFAVDGNQGEPPQYALLAAGLGSFRGVAVNALWYRAEMMKRAGQFAEANTLATWITNLQPRFPAVWGFLAWNMAYNISVETFTPQERWDWVKKGIELLREQGIPYNPNAVVLYRELAWILFHKVGQFTDDVNWYYKGELAREWEELLGAGPEQLTPRDYLESFGQVAAMAERYLSTDASTDRARDATTVFLEENPRALPHVQRMRELGLGLDEAGLRAIGQCLMFLRFRTPDVVAQLPPMIFSDASRRALPMVVDALGQGASEDTLVGFQELVQFLRAKVLIESYHMQPTIMYRYMQTYGPLDWRHVHSHSFYWARLGVERYYNLRDDTKTDLLNTMRLALHSVQSLSDYGTVSFNPLATPGRQIDLLPDPDFIEGYFQIVRETQAMADNNELGVQIRADAFAAGEENFLQKAVLFSYLYGSEAQAAHYFQRLIREYGDEPHNANRTGWYDLPLGDFVAQMVFTDDLGRPGMISLINSRLNEAFRTGLGMRRFQVFSRNLEIAQAVHKLYSDKYGHETGLQVGGGRMRLPPFPQMVDDAFTAFMQNRAFDLLLRVNAYQTAYQAAASGMPLAASTYRRWEESLRQELTAQGLDPDLAIPVPPNVVERAEGLEQRQGGQTIQRQ